MIRSAFEGVVNAVWFAGDVVLRITNLKSLEKDTYTESVAAPAVRVVSGLTPALLVFDDDRDLVDAPITIYERAAGIPLSKVSHHSDPEGLFFEIAAAIRKIHAEVRECHDPMGYLDEAWHVEPGEILQRYDNRLPTEIRTRLEQWSTPREAELVFAHQDLHPDNILIHEGKLSALIDWGDAGWGDRASDLRFIPARYLPAAEQGYALYDPHLSARIRLHLLDQFLYAESKKRSYGPYGDSNWDDVAALFG